MLNMKLLHSIAPPKQACIPHSCMSPLTELTEDSQNNISCDGYDTDLEEDQSKSCEKKFKAFPDRYSFVRDLSQMRITKQLDGNRLMIPHMSMGARGTKIICSALKKYNYVSHIDLSDNSIGAEGLKYLKKSVNDFKVITYLNLSRNRLGIQGAIQISDILKGDNSLEVMIISHNDFEENSGKLIASGLERNVRLRELDLSNNELQQTGANYIGKSLAQNESLLTLNLSFNHIRLKGAVGICKGLMKNECLLNLDVSWNGFGYEGTVAFSSLLKKNQNLQRVNLSYNRINWRGAMQIASGLKANKSLKVLNLSGNPLTTTGCMDIIESIADCNQSIENLSLEGIPVVAEFEFMVSSIQDVSERFECKHGGIVSQHDFLGQRFDKMKDPLTRMIDFMNKKGMRATEIFYTFDKGHSSTINKNDFQERLAKAGIHLQNFEMQQLISQIKNTNNEKSNSKSIDYKMLARSINQQIEKNRNEKIVKREKMQKEVNYLKEIMSVELPELKNIDKTEPHLFHNNPKLSRGKVISMTTTLGSKKRPFGKSTVKKKKKTVKTVKTVAKKSKRKK